MTTLASSNRVQLAYMPQTVFDQIPVAGTPRKLRMTGETLDFAITKESDKEINAEAQLTSATTTGAQASGDIKVHMQYAEYDQLLAGVLRNTWSVYGTNGIGTAFTADFAANTITADVAPVGASAFTTLKPGQWFQVDAEGDVNHGAILRVHPVTAPTATVITLDPNTPATVSPAVAGVTLSTSRLTNDVVLTPFVIERQVKETNTYFAYRGMYPSKFSTEFNSGAITDGTFSFLGKDLVLDEAATNLPNDPAESYTFDIHNGVTGVGKIWENGAPLAGTKVKKMSFDIDSALRAQEALGELGLVGVGIGTFMVKGTLEVYFANGAMFQKYLNDTFTAVSIVTKDSMGNGYVLTLPRVLLTKATVQAGSKDSDLMASFEYTAYADMANAVPALRKTMFIDRFGAAVAP